MLDKKKNSYYINNIVGAKADFSTALELENSYSSRKEQEDFTYQDTEYNALANAFIPGYSKAGSRWDKTKAFFGSKSAKRNIADARRRHSINYAIGQGANLVKTVKPDLDPNLVDMGSQIVGMGAQAVGDRAAGWNRDRKEKKEKAAKNAKLLAAARDKAEYMRSKGKGKSKGDSEQTQGDQQPQTFVRKNSFQFNQKGNKGKGFVNSPASQTPGNQQSAQQPQGNSGKSFNKNLFNGNSPTPSRTKPTKEKNHLGQTMSKELPSFPVDKNGNLILDF